MPEWLDAVMRVVVSALALLVVFRLRGRRWLTKWRTHI
jgi:uncharacterized membrane protein YcaP (DUF421 family)